MPLSVCKACPDKGNCVKTCPKCEKQLKSQGIYSSNYIRPKVSALKREENGSWREIPFSALPTENTDKNPYFGNNIWGDRVKR